MMSTFENAIQTVMAHEGTDTNFWVNDEADLGGETVWGWSMLTIKRLGLSPRDLGLNQDTFTNGCLKNVSKAKCQELYKTYFWDKYGYGAINDQTVATKIFDFSVNAGPGNSAKVAQKAANACGLNVIVDGSLGQKSFAAINTIDPKTYLKALADEMTNYYLAIIKARPANAKFKTNWLKRAQWGVKS